MSRDYRFTINGRTFYAVRRRAREMLAWDGHGDPLLWFSWEDDGGERVDLACGVRTLREAQQLIDNHMENE